MAVEWIIAGGALVAAGVAASRGPGVGAGWIETTKRASTSDQGDVPPSPVALATPASLVVATCNLAHGRGLKPSNLLIRTAGEVRRRVEALGALAAERGADIVLVQEVDRDASWSHGVDEARLFAETAGLGAIAYQPNYRVKLPGFRLCAGNAILSRFPILDLEAVDYGTARVTRRFPGTKRGLAAKIELPAGEHLHVQCHHFHPYRRGARARQSAKALELVLRFQDTDRRPSAVILGGDFNMRTQEIRRSALAQLHWNALPPGHVHFEPTYPSYRPVWHFDHVLAHSGEWRIAEREVVSTPHSDHCLVFARLDRVAVEPVERNGADASAAQPTNVR